MMLFICPRGHRYGIAGYGEDLTAGIQRKGSSQECPRCQQGETFDSGHTDTAERHEELLGELGFGEDRP